MNNENYKFNLAVTELKEAFKILAMQYDGDSKKFSPDSAEHQVNKAMALAYRNSEKLVDNVIGEILK